MRRSECGKKTLDIMLSAYTSYNSYRSCPSPKLELLSKMPLVISVWLYWLLLEELCNNQKGIHWEGVPILATVLYCTALYLLYSVVFSCLFLSCFVLHFVVVCSGRSRPWAKGGRREGGGGRGVVLAFLPSAILFFLPKIKGAPPAPPLDPPLLCSTV